MTGRTLVARMDSIGDVLLAGPCIRAVAAGSESVTVLCGPRGRAAAELLPGVDDVISWCAPWIDPDPPKITGRSVEELIKAVRDRQFDRALILTSFHQSALPLALLLRLAGVGWIGAISEDYPGSLLDLRHQVPGDPPEAVRALSLAEAAGFTLPVGDPGQLAIKPELAESGGHIDDLLGLGDHGPDDHGYVVVHPAASVPARQPSVLTTIMIVRALVDSGHRVIITGTSTERELTSAVAGDLATDLSGRTDLAQMAAVLARADVLVAPNTGPAHLAAAVGTPVVSLFAPVVPAARWAPYGVPSIILGDQNAGCRDSRARRCPVAGHPCLDIDPYEVVRAVSRLSTGRTGFRQVEQTIGGVR